MARKDAEFRYVVEFPEGLSSRVGVYGLDSGRREVYGATAFMGISIEVGDQVEPHSSGRRTDTVAVKSYARVKATTVMGDRFNQDLSGFRKNWEELINEAARRQNANSIRVESRQDVDVAIERHRQAYEKQFEKLAGQLQDGFNALIEDHPLFDFPGARQEVEKHRLMVFSSTGEQGSMWLRL